MTESTGSYAKGLKTRQSKLDKAREMLGLSESANTYVQGSREREQALVSLSAEASKHYDKQTQKRLALAAAEKKYGEAAKTSAEAQKQYDLVVAGINKKYEEKGGKGANTAPATRRLDLSEIQNAAREEVRVIDGQQKDLECLRQSGLIDDQGYYSQKRELIQQSSKVEEAALQEQISRLQQEKVKGNDALAVKKQIADTEGKLAAKRLETGEKLKALSHEETLALDRQRLTMDALAASHKREMQQMLIQQQRTVSSAWMGTKERQRAESLWGIEASYLAEERTLRDRRMFTPNLSKGQQEEIDQRLAYLETEKNERIRIAKATYAELDQLQSQWELGAGFALQNYVDQAANVAQQTADAFTNTFKGMEDALVNFVMTGKLDFKSLANSIIADLVRIQARQMVAGLATGVRGFLGFATGGYTGDGGKYEPAGVVHRGEYVINAESTKRIGLGLLNRMNGYAQGGLVGGGAAAAAVAPVGGMQVNIHNYSGAAVEQKQRSGFDGKAILDVFIGEAANQLAGDYGPMGQAMRARGQRGI